HELARLELEASDDDPPRRTSDVAAEDEHEDEAYDAADVDDVAEALEVTVVDRGGEHGEEAAGDEPVHLVHVLLGARAAVDARRAVEVDDADDGDERGADEERPVEALADTEVVG